MLLPVFALGQSIDTAHYLSKPSPSAMRTDTLANNLLTYNVTTHQANLMYAGTLKAYFQNGLAKTSAIPTNNNQLSNGAGYITGVSISAGNGISITGSGTVGSPYVISTITPTIATTARTLNSNFTVSTTKPAFLFYTISAATTNPLLVGNSTATCYLEYSTNAGSTWTAAGSIGGSSAVGVTVTLQLTQTNIGQVCGIVPANALVRLRTATTGTATVTFVSSSEVTY